MLLLGFHSDHNLQKEYSINIQQANSPDIKLVVWLMTMQSDCPVLNICTSARFPVDMLAL